MASFASGSEKEKHKQASDDEGSLSIIGRDLHVVGELATDGIVNQCYWPRHGGRWTSPGSLRAQRCEETTVVRNTPASMWLCR